MDAPSGEKGIVPERVVFRRVNRKLAQEHEGLRLYSKHPVTEKYFLVDLDRNWLLDNKVELEAFARELEVLQPWEVMEKLEKQ